MASLTARPDNVYLVDASIYIFQAHFSPYVECLDTQGNELSAVFGFTQFLLQFLRRTRPTHVAVAMDESLFCGFRHTLCPDYKSNRELPDDNLAMQLAACTEISKLFGLATFGSKVYEADDIIGTLAHRVRSETAGKSAIQIISKDKDLAQLLVNDKDCLWDYSGNRKRYWKDIVTDFGVSPVQIPDYLGLTGDTVDCISGVPGVGPVKARELLRQFETMDGVYRNLDKVAALPLRGAKRLHSLLNEHQAKAELSRTLATIACHVDDAEEAFSLTELNALQLQTIDSLRLREYLSECAFEQPDIERLVSSTEHLLQSYSRP